VTKTVKCAVPAGDRCGEGSVWHDLEQALYWVDINRFLIHRFDPATENVRTWQFAEPVTALNLTADPNVLLVAFASRIALWKPSTNAIQREIYRVPTSPRMRCNDARVDPRGSLWMGTMLNNVGPDGEDLELDWKDGVLYRIDPDGQVSEWKRNIGIANTVAWSPDASTFYFADTPANVIYAYDYDISTGAISRERPFLTNQPGRPDGSVTDAEGYLWNARPGDGSVVRISPAGVITERVPLPCSRPTTCIFGGPDLRTLFIASIRSEHRLSGSIFSLQTEVPGLPPTRFGAKTATAMTPPRPCQPHPKRHAPTGSRTQPDAPTAGKAARRR